ncbi:PQQ-dependent sugar dehydrogenase [Aliiglaciecola sp. CAU 1673]|uniref:PQQ-dependent sugar dehydrogenase n=1 Tax=Aliiglaciecola sp. CAU 1673 TaxID=3032595 RepID=UPI0023DC196F|nr:PQQ-dependent sugar dehydrogenase [Aliiglaciecola sp. CAU 1673]MDF2179431.1 PQQ-dependent sugar dehydrogenase [Aliiglaciecola sp. CAU 1673]
MKRLIGLIGALCLSLPGMAQTPMPDYQVREVISGLHFPWAVVILSEGRFLVSEKSGQLRIVEDGQISAPIQGVPEVFFKSQGGLMDVVLHPDYAENGWLYLTYAHGQENGNQLRLMRAKLKDNKLIEQQVLFSAEPLKATPVHYGGRLAFLQDNSLVLSSGDGFDYREQAQVPSNHLGKMIRLMDDGSLPTDNPAIEGGATGLYSLGHRNPQGLAFDPVRKQLFANEHGPKGGDEINLIEAGKNYGWPVITYGKDYSGAQISPFTEYPGMQQPLVDWTPSIAPSALVVYRGAMFSELTGDLLSTTLKSQEVRRVVLDKGRVTAQESLFTELATRLRDIEVGPRGEIYLLSDDGRLFAITRH